MIRAMLTRWLDNQIWHHAAQTAAVRILVYSPNTDVYHTGLSVPDNKEYMIQFNVHHASEKVFSMRAAYTKQVI